ncbi:hypothetical protein D9M71_809640 [compost metagenome]
MVAAVPLGGVAVVGSAVCADAINGVRATASAILSALRLRFNIFPSQAMLPIDFLVARRTGSVTARWPLTAWLW